MALHRLARYDSKSALLAQWCRALSRAQVGFMLGLLAICLWDRGSALAGTPQSQLTALAASSISVTATLGGLTTTLFFLTAQLKVVGIAQYGVTELYRVRDYLPLMILVPGGVISGLVAIAHSGCAFSACALVVSPGFFGLSGISLLPSQLATEIALSFVLTLLFTVVIFALTLLSNLDPVTVARKFASRIDVYDAVEWGLVKITFSERGNKQVAFHEIESNRKNFGLRDPLMPVHELILDANNQRFGQLIGVLLERVANEYGRAWVTHAPDIASWAEIEVRSRKARRSNGSKRVQDRSFSREQIRARDQLAITLLVIHYIRRIPSNERFKNAADVRRQASQFQLSRLVATLAQAPTTDSYATASLDAAIDACLNAVLHISADFAKMKPHSKRDGLQSLAAAAAILWKCGRKKQASDAVEILVWCFWNTRHFDGNRGSEVVQILRSADDSLSSRLINGTSTEPLLRMPIVGSSDPWNDQTRNSQTKT